MKIRLSKNFEVPELPPELQKQFEKIRLTYEQNIGKEKYVIICNDYAGLELRVMTFYSRDLMMTKLLSDPKEDVHQNTSDELGVDRNPTGKSLNFLVQFGGMKWMLAENLTNVGVPTTPEEAEIYLLRWDQLYPGVKQQRLLWVDEHRQNGFIRYFTGRRRSIEDIDWNNRSSVHKTETTLANNAVQGVGQDFIKAAIIRTDWRNINVDEQVLHRAADIPFMNVAHAKLLKEYAKRTNRRRELFKKAKLVYALQVHDELIHFCLRSAAEEVAPLVSEMMCWRHPFPRHPDYRYCVPLVAEGGVGYDWKEAKGKEPMIKLNEGWDSYPLESRK